MWNLTYEWKDGDPVVIRARVEIPSSMLEKAKDFDLLRSVVKELEVTPELEQLSTEAWQELYTNYKIRMPYSVRMVSPHLPKKYISDVPHIKYNPNTANFEIGLPAWVLAFEGKDRLAIMAHTFTHELLHFVLNHLPIFHRLQYVKHIYVNFLADIEVESFIDIWVSNISGGDSTILSYFRSIEPVTVAPGLFADPLNQVTLTIFFKSFELNKLAIEPIGWGGPILKRIIERVAQFNSLLSMANAYLLWDPRMTKVNKSETSQEVEMYLKPHGPIRSFVDQLADDIMAIFDPYIVSGRKSEAQELARYYAELAALTHAIAVPGSGGGGDNQKQSSGSRQQKQSCGGGGANQKSKSGQSQKQQQSQSGSGSQDQNKDKQQNSGGAQTQQDQQKGGSNQNEQDKQAQAGGADQDQDQDQDQQDQNQGQGQGKNQDQESEQSQNQGQGQDQDKNQDLQQKQKQWKPNNPMAYGSDLTPDEDDQRRGKGDKGQRTRMADIMSDAVREAFTRMAGDLPGNLRQLIKAIQRRKQIVDWKRILEYFVRQGMNKRSWDRKKPHRRTLALNRELKRYGLAGRNTEFVLPSLRKNIGVKNFTILIDTSGSIPDKLFAEVVAEVKRLAELIEEPMWFYIVQFDVGIQKVERITTTLMKSKDTVERAGYGGTDPTDALKYIYQEIKPEVIFGFTDGYFFTSNLPQPPAGMKLIWFIPPEGDKPPIGETYRVDFTYE